MTWQDLGGLGEFIGSIAVVVSLIFVIHELRRSSRINRMSALQAVNATAFDLYDAPARDAELARIIRVGGDDLSRLSKDERDRLRWWVLGALRAQESMFVQHQYGTLDEQTWVSRETLMRGFLSRPGMLVIWSRSKGVFRRDFQDWVASIVDDSNRSVRNESPVRPGVEPDRL